MGALHYSKAIVLLATCLGPAVVVAHEEQSEYIQELIVYGRAQQLIGSAQAASEGTVGFDDITLPSLMRVGELVEAVPGMVATQHSGTGKANQYFLRGFNLDHGTDFSVFANGVPVNLRTHGHGQGYLDLNFLIPELVATTSYRKGPYSAEVGDFSSAGTVSFNFYDRLEENIVSFAAGEHDYYRTLIAGSLDTTGGILTGALDATVYSGPWDLDEDLEQIKAYVAHAGHLGAAESRIAFSAYTGEWNSSDQVPERAVANGTIGSLGFIDPDLGGSTDRFELSGSLYFDEFSAMAYIVDYDFELYSNFTYLLGNPVDGDEFEQVDDRTTYGARVDGERELSNRAWLDKLRWGADVRFDDIGEVGLFNTVSRQRTGVVRQDSVDELSLSAYSELMFDINPSLRASLGLRADYFDWDVNALRDANSGSGDEIEFSPKLQMAYLLSDQAEIYANWGRGLHSNDVRGVTLSVDPISGEPAEAADPVARSNGAELGLRLEGGDKLNATITAFWLELDSELLFVGDAGTTEINDGTERIGVELSTFWQATEWLAANFAYTYTDAEFQSDQGPGKEIPGAIETNAVLGLTAAWENGAFGSLRVRYLGDAPLVEDGSVESDDSLLVNAGFGYRWDDIEFRLDAFNLLDADDNDISYFFASRLEGEPPGGVEDVHSRRSEPRSVRASIAWHWQ